MKVEYTDYYLSLDGKGLTESHGGTVTPKALKKLKEHVELLDKSNKNSIKTNYGTITKE